MKTFLKLFVAVVAMISMAASAQVYPNTWTGPGLTTTSVAIAGITTSNLPTTLQASIPVGPNGVGLSFTTFGTNATTTTNATVVLQGTADGTTWIDTPTTASAITVLVSANGTSIYGTYTNLIGNTATAQNIGNLRSLRIKSIQNTNTATLWISNVVWSIR